MISNSCLNLSGGSRNENNRRKIEIFIIVISIILHIVSKLRWFNLIQRRTLRPSYMSYVYYKPFNCF